VENQEERTTTFTDFLLWLATMAAVQFGDLPDPVTGNPVEANIPAAGHLVEVIGMLQEKTSGNLDPMESKLLDDLLYELRMRFIQAQQGEKRIITP
jgi:hypothetical protein